MDRLRHHLDATRDELGDDADLRLEFVAGGDVEDGGERRRSRRRLRGRGRRSGRGCRLAAAAARERSGKREHQEHLDGRRSHRDETSVETSYPGHVRTSSFLAFVLLLAVVAGCSSSSKQVKTQSIGPAVPWTSAQPPEVADRAPGRGGPAGRRGGSPVCDLRRLRRGPRDRRARPTASSPSSSWSCSPQRPRAPERGEEAARAHVPRIGRLVASLVAMRRTASSRSRCSRLPRLRPAAAARRRRDDRAAKTTTAPPPFTSVLDIAACDELETKIGIVSQLVSSSVEVMTQSVHPKQLAKRAGATRDNMLYAAHVLDQIVCRSRSFRRSTTSRPACGSSRPTSAARRRPFSTTTCPRLRASSSTGRRSRR